VITIKDLDEAKLMDDIFYKMISGKIVFHMIPHEIGIDSKYFASLIERIVDYNDNHERIIRYTSSEDYYNFRSIHETDEFINYGGFEKVYQDIIGADEHQIKISNLETSNLELQNRALEYEETIRLQSQTIRDLQETDLRLSIFQKFWWLISLFLALISWFHKEIANIILNILK